VLEGPRRNNHYRDIDYLRNSRRIAYENNIERANMLCKPKEEAFRISSG